MQQVMDAVRGLQNIVRDTWASASALSLTAIILHSMLTWDSLIIVVAIAIGYSYAYIINDYYDAMFDEINPQKAERNIFVTEYKIDLKILVVVLVSILLVLFFLFNNFGLTGRIIYLISIIVPILYSAKPFRLKSRPVFDLITHALFVSSYPYFITILLLDVEFITIDYIILGLAILLSFTVQLENQIRDYKYDIQNDNNFTIKFGWKKSVLILRIATTIAIVGGILIMVFGLVSFYLYPAIILLLPWLIHRLIRNKNSPRSETLVKITTYVALIYLLLILVVLTISS